MSDPSKSPNILSAWEVSPYRIWVLAQHTFTQLVRMKTFYFLIVFVVIILIMAAAGLLWQPVKHLLMIKRWSFGAMHVFTLVYAMAATALLLPRDLEDRTLYTILSKPVPRFEYLAGRLLGVVIVIGTSLLAMYLFMCVLVAWKMPGVEAEMISNLQARSGGEAISMQEVQGARLDAQKQGVTLSLFWALWAVFLKACVIAAIALFISTFASSSLFTIVMTAMVVMIGHFHQLATDYWLNQEGANIFQFVTAKAFLLIFPNMGLYNITDEIITGMSFATSHALEMTGLSLFYIALYLLLSLIVFVDKEL